MSFSKSTNNKTLCPHVTPDSTGHAPVQVCAGVCWCVLVCVCVVRPVFLLELRLSFISLVVVNLYGD